MRLRLGVGLLGMICAARLGAQTLSYSNITYDTVVSSGLSFPIAIAFLDPADPSRFFVIEKNSGRVKLVQNGAVVSTVLDLPVNYASERGLLGIALHPAFAENGYVYLYYTRSSTGGDTNSTAAWVDNRVERYRWDGSALVEPQLIVSFPRDPAQNNGPNHNGGVILFGPDGKLYGVTGDLNRGFFSNPRIEQNTSPTAVAGVGGIFRLDPDGSIPPDNPFVSHPDPRIRWLWAYGIRNSFGITFDSLTARLWITENGPDVYDEVNLVERGFNSGWLKIMGPDARNATYSENGNRAYNASDLIYLPNSYYADPVFSWLQPIGVTSIVFVRSARFDANMRDTALIGESNNSGLYQFVLNAARDDFVLSGALADRVADSAAERNLSRIGTNWGVITDLRIGPDGYLYVVSLYANRVYRIRPVNPPPIVHGQAQLQGRQGLPLGVPLTLELIQGGSTVQTISTTLDAYGAFSERVNASGTYTVRARVPKYLPLTVPSVSIASQGFAYLRLNFDTPGDLNGDGVINNADLLTVLFAFGSNSAEADLNNDGVVNNADLLVVLFNFGRSG
ncbi:MAG: PQQ-dependent sugar dehydrogenase [Armatimonadota bacterium]|nr:PQQ-dependent sugar dehydrogenase [Armatimonadota bacterium]